MHLGKFVPIGNYTVVELLCCHRCCHRCCYTLSRTPITASIQHSAPIEGGEETCHVLTENKYEQNPEISPFKYLCQTSDPMLKQSSTHSLVHCLFYCCTLSILITVIALYTRANRTPSTSTYACIIFV